MNRSRTSSLHSDLALNSSCADRFDSVAMKRILIGFDCSGTTLVRCRLSAAAVHRDTSLRVKSVRCWALFRCPVASDIPRRRYEHISSFGRESRSLSRSYQMPIESHRSMEIDWSRIHRKWPLFSPDRTESEWCRWKNGNAVGQRMAMKLSFYRKLIHPVIRLIGVRWTLTQARWWLEMI